MFLNQDLNLLLNLLRFLRDLRELRDLRLHLSNTMMDFKLDSKEDLIHADFSTAEFGPLFDDENLELKQVKKVIPEQVKKVIPI